MKLSDEQKKELSEIADDFRSCLPMRGVSTGDPHERETISKTIALSLGYHLLLEETKEQSARIAELEDKEVERPKNERIAELEAEVERLRKANEPPRCESCGDEGDVYVEEWHCGNCGDYWQ